MSKTRKSIDYKQRMKIIRQFVGFDYDLRKSLNSGQKSAITKAFREVSSYRAKRFVPLRKHKNETNREFKQRKRLIKDETGQSTLRGRMIRGVFVDVPKDIKVRAGRKGLKFFGKNFTETFIPSDTGLLAEDPEAEAEDIWRNEDFDFIFINYSGFGRSAGFEKEYMEDDKLFDDFTEELRRMSDEYKKVLQFAVSGYILRKYKKGVRGGAKKNRRN